MSGWFWLVSAIVALSGAVIFLSAVARAVQHGEQRLKNLENKLRRACKLQALNESGGETTVAVKASTKATDSQRAA